MKLFHGIDRQAILIKQKKGKDFAQTDPCLVEKQMFLPRATPNDCPNEVGIRERV